jgi:preprotein translocase subunit SecE
MATETVVKNKNAIARSRDFVSETLDELKKVTWPDFPQLKNATLVIIVFVIIVSLIIWVMDLSVRGIMNVIMDLFAR